MSLCFNEANLGHKHILVDTAWLYTDSGGGLILLSLARL